jgi:Zn-dependent protease
MTVAIGDRALGHDRPVNVVGWTLNRLNLLPGWILDGEGQWLHVVNPSRSKPMVALRFTEPVRELLSQRGTWLLQ